MVRNGRRPITSTRPVRLTVVVALVVLLSGMWAARAQAAVSADLSVAISGPTSAPAGSPFAYSVEVTNLGPDATDGATLVVDLPAGSTGLSASCTTSSGGAACPTAVQVASGQARATFPSMPAARAVVITIAGRFGSGATATATAAVTSSVPDPDPSKNSASLVTRLDPTSAGVVLSTTVDPTTAAFGQTITYATLVANTGSTDLAGLSLESRFSTMGQGAQHVLTMSGTVSCDASAADAAACPAGLSDPHPYEVAFIGQDASFDLSGVSVPAGKTLYLTFAVAFRTSHCDSPHHRHLANTVTLSVPEGATTSATSPVLTLSTCTEPSPSGTPTTPTPTPSGQPTPPTPTPTASATTPIPTAPSQPVPSPTQLASTATRRASVSPTSATTPAAPPTLEIPAASASSSSSATASSPRPATDPGRVQVFTGPTDNGGGVALAAVGAVMAVAGASVALRRP